MEMCYDGALMMPSSYAVMNEDEMTYVEGGGVVRIQLNQEAARFLTSVGAAAAFGIITALMGATGAGAIVSNLIGNLVFNFIVDNVIGGVGSVDVSWDHFWLPNFTFSWNR